jgi:hypothetical protein
MISLLLKFGPLALKLVKGVSSLFTGGSLDSILKTIDKNVEAGTRREEIKADVTKRWIDAQANLLVGRTWWFQLFFVIPLGVYWSALLWVSGFPQFGWTVHALPSPYYEWAAGIISALFIVDGGKALMGRLKG